MKKAFSKLLSSLLLCGLVLSPITAFASSQDVTINKFTLRSYQQYVTGQRKDNKTSCYVKIVLDGYSNCKVNVYGQTSAGTASKALANYGGNDRVISSGKAYFVRNSVKELGYGYASLGFIRNTSSDYKISGLWSPDSVSQSGVTTI